MKFLQASVRNQLRFSVSLVKKLASPSDNSEAATNRGYQFGDLFINKLTKKDKYEFGDLSRWVGSKLQEAACSITGKETYEFGDISRFMDGKARAEVNKLTGKENYEFGDITKEIIRRVQAGEVDPKDLSLLLRVLISFGAGLTPVASAIPAKVLIDLLTWNLEFEVGSRATQILTDSLAQELDRRAKVSLLGREKYQFGDLTREQLQKAVSSFTGKADYEFGDITRTVIKGFSSKSSAG